MERVAGRDAIDELDTADLDQAMAVQRIETGRFGIKHDFAHLTWSCPLLAGPAKSSLELRQSHESPRLWRILAIACTNVAHLRAGMIERLRTIHDKVGAPALFRIGHLLADQGGKFLLGHSRPLEGALALHARAGADTTTTASQ